MFCMTTRTGKSNLMDAISFVLGVQSAQLRGKQLIDLIHRSSVEEALPKSVTHLLHPILACLFIVLVLIIW
jgi:hypothetical protein